MTNRTFLVFVAAAALHACLRGSFPSGCPYLLLSQLKSGNTLHLLPGRLHYPPVPEPCDLWLSGRAIQEVLGPVRGLLEPKHHPGQTSDPEGELGGEITITGLLQVQLAASQSGLQTDVCMLTPAHWFGLSPSSPP